MHANFQQQLQAQQSDSEARIRQLSTSLESDRDLLSRLASPSTLIYAASSHLPGPKNTMHADREGAFQSQPHLDIHHLEKPASNKSYPGQPSPPFNYAHRNPYHSSATVPPVRIKASDLPKFNGSKDEDVEIWLGQVSAIFDANKCADSEIVAYLSVSLKETALKWFTRLGKKRRSKFITWIDCQDGFRQRFLKPNYLAGKKRQWKQRELRIDEDISDYFDDKVDLQAFVFDQGTPDSELILDVVDGLSEYMLPTLKSSMKPGTSLLDFRRTLLDYEKGLRWDGTFQDEEDDEGSMVSETFSDRLEQHPGNTSTSDTTSDSDPDSERQYVVKGGNADTNFVHSLYEHKSYANYEDASDDDIPQHKVWAAKCNSSALNSSHDNLHRFDC